MSGATIMGGALPDASLSALLATISDPVATAARLEELQATEASARTAIDQHKKLAAKNAADTAEIAKRAADIERREAAHVNAVAEAETRHFAMAASLESRTAVVATKEKELAERAATTTAELALRTNLAELREAAVTKREQDVTQREADVSQLKRRLDAKMDKLNELLNL